jgi:hypothetical protein
LGQAPNSFKYQAVIRNTSGIIIANKPVGVRISILQDNSSGSSVYTETHVITTNSYGIVNLNIGEGTVVLGSFSGINWGAHSHFAKVEINETGGSNYVEIGTTPLLSVPYAKYAKKAGNGFSGDYNDLKNKPSLATYDSVILSSDSYKFSLRVDDAGNLIVKNISGYPIWSKCAPYQVKAETELLILLLETKAMQV